MRRGAIVCGLLLCVWLSTSSTALAASDVELKHAADGTLLVIGSGWGRDRRLVISLGRQQFTVRTDTSGDFELATGLAWSSGELAVHHPAPPTDLGLGSAGAATPDPFAALFVTSVAEGAALLGIAGGVGLLGAGVLRRVRVSRYPRG